MTTENGEFSRHALLQRCRTLVRRIRPNLPPEGSTAHEFAWQCRALAERVQTYEELLGNNPDRLQGRHLEFRLQRLETALGASLEYFRRVYLDVQAGEVEEDPVPARRNERARESQQDMQ